MAVVDRKYRLCKCSIRTIYPLKSKLKQKKSGKSFAVKTKLATFAAANRELKPLSKKNNAPVAQLVEHLTLNQRVQGSNPCRRTNDKVVGKNRLLRL